MKKHSKILTSLSLAAAFIGLSQASSNKTDLQAASQVIYTPIINNNPSWKIALWTNDGQLSGEYLPTNTTWKVVKTKYMHGQTYYCLGTDKQWIPAKYATNQLPISQAAPIPTNKSQLNGIDVASYQPNINVANVEGDFAIVKATEGTGYVNPYFKNQAQSTIAGNKLLGLYHFADGYDYRAEADHFLNHARPYLGKSILALDFEGDVTKTGGVTWAKNFLDYVQLKTGQTPFIYMGLSDENHYNWSSVANKYPLWVAQYNNYNTNHGYTPRNIYGKVKHWDKISIFQYSASNKIKGWSDRVDTNVAYLSPQQWNHYAGNGQNASSQAPIVPKNAPKTQSVHAVSQNLPVNIAYALIINGNPNWKIALRNQDGSMSGGYLATNTNWRVLKRKLINGELYYCLGSDKQWAPAKYFKGNIVAPLVKTEVLKTPVVKNIISKNVIHVPVINNNPSWKVALLDQDGKFTGNYLTTNTNWKVFGTKIINGETYYCLGSNRQWIPAKYTSQS